jgi:hypothetical protein
MIAVDRFIHDPMTVLERLPRRFWEKIAIPEGELDCWEWLAGKSGSRGEPGYGIDRIEGRKTAAQNIVYTLGVGEIPDGLILDHLCENRGCVNPNHLEPVTNRENVLRGNGRTAINARKTHCKNGHPFEEGNLEPYALKHGQRRCLICWRKSNNAHSNASQKRKRQRNAAT